MYSNRNVVETDHKRQKAIELIATLIQRYYMNKSNEQKESK
ncbi:hypothetical protein [Alkalibacillus haloalkaliphilus]|nr:hypothetical protein [Alkalibacillus haloalkaliphilus]